MVENGGHSLELTIVMPCLNEAETLEACIAEAMQAIRDGRIEGEVVVADNGSTDGSVEIAINSGARVIHVKKRGYGSALIEGCRAARGKYVMMGDADRSYDFGEASEFVAKLREGYDLVMGNRFRGKIEPGAMPWKNRYIGNPILTGIGRLFFRAPVADFHCGLRAFSKAAFEQMDLQTTGMEFASEMVIKASLLGMKTCEIPIVLRPDGRSRQPHLRPWRDGWRHLRFMLLYSPRWLFLYPGILLMSVGLALGTWLMPNPHTIGSVVLDVHTMFFAMIVALMGYQAFCFGVTTKIYAVTHGLHPKRRFPFQIFRYFNLEVGLAIGATVLFAGFAGLGCSVYYWDQHGFGPLNPSDVLRIIIPSAFLVLVGMQTLLTSFFLSMMGLKRK